MIQLKVIHCVIDVVNIEQYHNMRRNKKRWATMPGHQGWYTGKIQNVDMFFTITLFIADRVW